MFGIVKQLKKTPQTFTVILRDKGIKKVETVKAVRDLLKIDIREAFDLVMEAPSVLATNVSKEEADVISEVFQGVATLEIKEGESD